MSIRNTYYGGATNWSAGNVLSATDLNDTINATLMSTITRTFTNGGAGTNTLTPVTALTLLTPPAAVASQTVYIEMAGLCSTTDGGAGNIILYDNTAGATILTVAVSGTFETDGGDPELDYVFMMATVVLASAGASKSILLRVQNSSGNPAEFASIASAKLTCQLVTS